MSKFKFSVTTKCPFCDAEQVVEFRTPEDLRMFKNYGFTQFGYLSKNQREALISGICDKCWDNYMPYED